MRIAVVVAVVAVLAVVLAARAEDSERQVFIEMSLASAPIAELAPWGVESVPATEEASTARPLAMPSIIATLGNQCEVKVGEEDAPQRFRIDLHPTAAEKPGTFSVEVDARVVRVLGEADATDLRETRRRLDITAADGEIVRIGLGADAAGKGETLALTLTVREVRRR